jgi:UDP-N-acetyl-D-glucosamine dehydrogenase
MPDEVISPENQKALFDTIAIIGLGYVGLPLALQFAKTCTTVIGIDVDPAKIGSLNAGQTYMKHIGEATIADVVRSKKFQPTSDIERVRDAEAIIICVPTPLTKTREPDLSYVLNTGRAVAPHLRRGTLVVLESTSYPGTTEDELRAVLEENAPLVEKAETLKNGKAETPSSESTPQRMRAGVDFHLAFSPEREDPGNPNSKVAKVPKIVGGYTPKCLEKAVALYSRAVEKVVPVSSCKVAEATKLLENIFRSVNIALVNELKVIYAAMGIDIWEVIEAAKTKPFGFMPFYPGPGLGGHCIPIDPFYLAWKAREFGKHTRFIELAGEINTAMPDYVIQRLTEALNSQRKTINGSKILLVGLAYKPDVDDMRESPTFILMDKLSALGAEVAYYDPHIPEIGPTREHSERQGTRSVDWDEKTIRRFDAAVVVTAHRVVKYQQLVDWTGCIVDTRNAIQNKIDQGTSMVTIWKA